MLVNSGGPRENACKSTGMPAGRCRPMGPSSISQQRDATSATESQHWDEQRVGRWRILGLQKEPHGCQEPPSPPATHGANGAMGKAGMQGDKEQGLGRLTRSSLCSSLRIQHHKHPCSFHQLLEKEYIKSGSLVTATKCETEGLSSLV